MNSTWTFIVGLILKILIPLFKLVTPEIHLALNQLLTDLYLKAMATPNPWDDMAIGFLMDILVIPRPPPD